MDGSLLLVRHPLNLTSFEQGLADCPDAEMRQFVLDGIRSGVRLGPVDGLAATDVKCCRNGKGIQGHEKQLFDMLLEEVRLGRKFGPFEQQPFSDFRCSPVNFIPKRNSEKVRLIHNLSYPFKGDSVNSLIAPEEARVVYQRFEEFVSMVREAGPNAELGKFDLHDAYKYVLVHPDFWPRLGIHVGEGKERRYFVEATLPFGHRLAPKIFTEFAKGVHWIAQKNGAEKMFVFVDDFVTARCKGTGQCARDLKGLRAACAQTGFEVQDEKEEGPCTSLPVLGILVDTVRWELRIEPQKLHSLSEDLAAWDKRRTASIREIASLHGRLSFIAQVVKPGRIFLRRFVEEMKRSTNFDAVVTLSAEFHAELRWWLELLPNWNGVTLIPEEKWISNADFELWTDALGMGFGAYWQGAYLLGEFSDWARKQSIAFKELYAVVAAVATWGSRWSGKKIRLYCDNRGVCEILRYKNSHSPTIAALL